MSVSVAPNSMRERYGFAIGIGWQAIALAASVMAQEAGSKWLNHLETRDKAIRIGRMFA